MRNKISFFVHFLEDANFNCYRLKWNTFFLPSLLKKTTMFYRGKWRKAYVPSRNINNASIWKWLITNYISPKVLKTLKGIFEIKVRTRQGSKWKMACVGMRPNSRYRFKEDVPRAVSTQVLADKRTKFEPSHRCLLFKCNDDGTLPNSPIIIQHVMPQLILRSECSMHTHKRVNANTTGSSTSSQQRPNVNITFS